MKPMLARPVEPIPDGRPVAINPEIEPHVLTAVDSAIREAWNRLLSDASDRQVLEQLGEVKITPRLRAQLNALRIAGTVAGYNAKAFERPYAGAEYLNHKGEKVRKPDLIFALAGAPRPGCYDDLNDALFIECKLIDEGRKNVGLYCSKGLIRFVDGSYSWRMKQGMMLAYVRTTQTLPSGLEDGLATHGRAKACETDGKVLACPLSMVQPRVYLTNHGRSWSLPEGMAPGPIQVRHLWLPVFGYQRP